MTALRTLIIDPQVVVRRALVDAIGRGGALEPTAVASSVAIGLAKLEQVAFDVVIVTALDADGSWRGLLERARECRPNARLVALVRDPTEAVAARSAGLLCATWPDGIALEPAAAAVVERAVALLGASAAPRTSHVLAPRPSWARRDVPIEILAIGASTGGPRALDEVIPQLPGDLGLPIVITQHMPPGFTKKLAEQLDAKSRVRVVEAAHGMPVTAGVCYIAPGDHHMIVVRRGTKLQVELHQGPPENSCRPAVDVMLRSVADIYGAAALAVILTGMGQDGLLGCERVHAAGGPVIAQDEATSVVWGMPGAVAKAGYADKVVPIEQVSLTIVRIVQGRVADSNERKEAS
jgi:two-component system chemotaxis response regulator CheB